MNYSVSNIAWSPGRRLRAYDKMRNHGFSGLEVAPGLLFTDCPDPLDPPESSVQQVMCEIKDYGLELVSLQSLLFGHPSAQLFGDSRQRSEFVFRIKASINLAARIGVQNLVFGSPKNRAYPQHMSLHDALNEAQEVLVDLGDLAKSANCTIAIEPNPSQYGTNFLTSISDTVAFVRRCHHPAISLNLDIGAIIMNNEFDDLETSDYFDIASHIHVSEPMLAPAPATLATAEWIKRRLNNSDWEGWLSIEMAALPDDPNLDMLSACMKRLHGGEPLVNERNYAT